jgi:hypothetical protein
MPREAFILSGLLTFIRTSYRDSAGELGEDVIGVGQIGL